MKKRLLTALAVLTGMLLLSASIVWAQPAPVAATGQTTSYRTGDDGDLQKGVAIPPPYQFLRFKDNGDGTVTDNLTGLMWAKNANIFGERTWADALSVANNLSLGSAGCGLSYTDWRLPNSNELYSLTDKGNYGPALPSGHPFSNVRTTDYWSSTTHAVYTDRAWSVYMYCGYVDFNNKTNYSFYVWPVRDAN